MKKNKPMRLATLLLVFTLVTSCFVGGTFAKYTSEQTGTDTATVAKWSFNVEDKDIATQEFTFDLFSTANHDEENADVVDGLIAPGTSGSFELNIENTSQVSAQYAVDLTYTNDATNPVPLKFRVDAGDWKTNIDELESVMTKELEHTTGNTAAHTIEWVWEFTDTDESAIGIAAPGVTVTAKITATQVN